MIKQHKHKIIKTFIITLLITVFVVVVYLWVAHQKSFWPFYSETQSQSQDFKDEKDSTKKRTLQRASQSSRADDNSSDASVYNDGYLEGKTPIQYEGQTDASGIHGDGNNEQFRIPEDEL